MPMHKFDNTVSVERYDPQNPFDAYAKVTITLPNGKVTEFTIHPSKTYSDTVNVEIDGDFTADASMRIHLNDHLIVDTTVNDNRGPAELDDTREPDLDDGMPMDVGGD